MRTASVGASQPTSPLPLRLASRLRFKSVDAVAADLICFGYMWPEHYLEMKHLDPKWMVAIHVYAVALYKAVGGRATALLLG